MSNVISFQVVIRQYSLISHEWEEHFVEQHTTSKSAVKQAKSILKGAYQQRGDGLLKVGKKGYPVTAWAYRNGRFSFTVATMNSEQAKELRKALLYTLLYDYGVEPCVWHERGERQVDCSFLVPDLVDWFLSGGNEQSC